MFRDGHIRFVMSKECPIHSVYFSEDGKKAYCTLVARVKQTGSGEEYKSWKSELDLLKDDLQ